MKYGKIRIEDGFLVFTRHMMINSLPCKDKDEADAIETAVENVLNAGHRTADIAAKGEKVLSTSEMGALIREQL